MNHDIPENLRRILLVDDNRSIHEDFRKILVEGAGALDISDAEAGLFGSESLRPGPLRFALISAFQGQEALSAVEAGPPFDVAFVDMRMPPGWDGVETAERLWLADPDLQVVICTAYSDYDWEEMLERLGNTDRLVILKKPFDVVEVLQLANALSEKRRLLERVRRHLMELESTVKTRTEELARSEERFRLITENAADLIGIVDAQGRRLYDSPSHSRLLGYTPAELAGSPAFAQAHPEDHARVLAAARRTIRDGTSHVVEYRVRHKNGPLRILESHGVPFRNAAGAIEGALTVARDITERRQAEQQKQKLEHQLRQAQKLEAIGHLAAGVAHEISTPTEFIGDNMRFLRDAFAELQKSLAAHGRLLAAAESQSITPALIAEIRATARATNLDYLAAEIPRAIEQSLDGVARTTKIVSAMKEFSHPGTKEKMPMDVNKTIESTLAISRSEWKYVAQAVTELAPDLPLIPVLPGEFSQVVLNLVINAAHAIAARTDRSGPGTITLSTRHDGDWVEMRIRDNGTGMPEHIRDHVFDPFFTTKQVGKGTGQGLAIARSIVVEMHGGSIAFETKVGHGTVFIVRLPVRARGSAR